MWAYIYFSGSILLTFSSAKLALEEARTIEEELELAPARSSLQRTEPSRTEQEKREHSYKRKLIRQIVRKKEGR